MRRLVFVLALLGGARHVSAEMYGTTAISGINPYTLVEVDVSTGATTAVGDAFEFWTSLDTAPDGVTLYAVDEHLFTINSADGTYSDVGSLSFEGTTDIDTEAMSVSPGGDIYVISSRSDDPSGKERLYTVDAGTAAMTLVGELDQSKPINAMEFAADGTLYAAYGDLYILDPTSGAIVQTIGDLGAPYLDGLDIDQNGVMIGLNDFHNKLYTIDPAGSDGALATHLVDVPNDELYSLASGSARGVPEPSSAALMWFAVAAVAALCGRRARICSN